MFQDNKASRATHLEEELADFNFESFSSIDSYCNHIKSLADQLADVDAPLTNSKLVLKLTTGLPEAYARTEGNSDNSSQATLLTSIDSHHDTDNNTSTSSASSRQSSKGNKQKKSNSKVSGKSRNSNGQVAPQQSGLMPFNWQQQPWAAWAPWLAQWLNPPPCPYPASS
ncbi:uncharacterized protein [Glycine max]|uniref:uncharacterized protein n=1 Tax=Glycine max TaxID=3847 RepID=UPI0003DE9068|nr:uncharacterized protein LOC102665091 [Glycine max]|eukprot:XP_006593050.1 uncharacterized protein LOC102665091 [Glycine max]